MVKFQNTFLKEIENIKTSKRVKKLISPPSLEDFLAEKEEEKRLKDQLDDNLEEGDRLVRIGKLLIPVKRLITLTTVADLLLTNLKEEVSEDIKLHDITFAQFKKAVVKTLVYMSKAVAIGYAVHLHGFGYIYRDLKQARNTQMTKIYLLNIGRKKTRKSHFVIKYQPAKQIKDLLKSDLVLNDPVSNALLRGANSNLTELIKEAEKFNAQTPRSDSNVLTQSTQEGSLNNINNKTEAALLQYTQMNDLEKSMRKIMIGDVLLDEFDLDVDNPSDLLEIKALYEQIKHSDNLGLWKDIIDFPLYYP